jgi:hypothetical protein
MRLYWKAKEKLEMPSPIWAVALFIWAAFGREASPSSLRLSAAPGSPLAVAGQPNGVASADLNADGKADLVVTHGAGSVSILLGNGRGAFSHAPGSPLPVSSPPHLAALGDLDRDAKPDLVVTAHDSHGVFVWRGDGTGRFEPVRGSPFPALPDGKPHNHGLALGDLDGDGDLDVATTDDEAHGVAVLRNDGAGGFRPAEHSPFAVGRQPYPLALGDLNRDGSLDVVTPNVGSASVSVLLGDGRGGFTPARTGPIGVTARPYFVALGDLDGDSRLDAVTIHDDVALATVLTGDGQGGLRPLGAPVDLGRRGAKAVLHDMDRDGKTDLVVAVGGAVAVLLGNGRAGWAPVPGSPFPVGRGAWSLAVADFDGDGRSDVATADLEAGTLSVLLQR